MRVQPLSPSAVHSPPIRSAEPHSVSKPFAEHLAHKPQAGHASDASRTTKSSGAPSTSSASSTAAPSSEDNDSGIQSSLDESEDQNMQFLEVQSEVNEQSTTFTTLSNVMKTENDTLKNTAANMAI
jgi:hypothetical protein